ncbi:MAG TPA: PEP-utilizing enzyme, partial [Kofleriaceae bacterium]
QARRKIHMVSPSWDIAVPTFGERPGLIERAIAVAKSIATPVPSTEDSDLASIISDLAERDDLLFARWQLLARASFLVKGRFPERTDGVALGDDIFWLDPDEPYDTITSPKQAAAARAAHARASTWKMPLVVGPDAPPEHHGEPLHGHGHGARVTGRVVRFGSLAAAIFAKPGEVVVVRAVTPALALFVGECAALVSETGGPLDHGAALARELGITCVVGCHGAWERLVDGMLVEVDGETGTVTLH